MLKEAIQKVCWDRIDSYASVKTKCNFSQYRGIAEELSAPAQCILIWTLHGSPLDVSTGSKDPLSSQDIFFRDHNSIEKIRLVVFNSPWSVKRYAAIKARLASGTPISPRCKRLSENAKRIQSFEAASKTQGKLYYTSIGLIGEKIGHNFSRLDAGFVSDDGKHVFCFRSSFAASRQRAREKPGDIRDLHFFNVADVDYPGAAERRQYHELVLQLRNGRDNDWYFVEPAEVAHRSSRRRYLLEQLFRIFSNLWHWVGETWKERGISGLVMILTLISLIMVGVFKSAFHIWEWAKMALDLVFGDS
jgi:hypothetical protein